jgi:malate dehydrogenase (oxaloacetate-decarboxylating)(NADP+)
MRDALELIRDAAPDLAVDGEMHGDAALAKQVLDRVFPGSDLAADVNLLIMSATCAAS